MSRRRGAGPALLRGSGFPGERRGEEPGGTRRQAPSASSTPHPSCCSRAAWRAYHEFRTELLAQVRAAPMARRGPDHFPGAKAGFFQRLHRRWESLSAFSSPARVQSPKQHQLRRPVPWRCSHYPLRPLGQMCSPGPDCRWRRRRRSPRLRAVRPTVVASPPAGAPVSCWVSSSSSRSAGSPA